MKKALRKDCFKEIIKSYKRFISILLMSFLGVGFFAGVRATSPDMRLTIDKYLDTKNVYDIKLVSTLGLTEDDITEINKLEEVKKAVGTFSEDVFVLFDEEETVVKAYALENDINQMNLIEGKYPEKSDECVIEENMKTYRNIQIGDYVEIQENLGEDEEPSFKNTKLKVVGTVKSPLYISRDRGTTSLGSGKISYYMYMNKENINSDIYTDIYIQANGAKEEFAVSTEYDEKIIALENSLKSIKEERQTARYTELINEANTKLNDAQKEFDEEKADAEKKIADAEKAIEDGKKEIQKGEKEIQNSEKKLKEGREKANQEFLTAEGQITEGEAKINSSQSELDNAKALFYTKKLEAQAGIDKINNGIKTIDKTISDLNTQKKQVETVVNNLNTLNTNLENLKLALSNYEKELETNPENVEEIKIKIEQIKIQIAELEENKKFLESLGITQETLNQINAGITEANSQKTELQKNLKSINSELSAGEAQINNGQAQIDSGRAELENSKEQLSNARIESENKFKEAEIEIANGRKEIADAKKKIEDGEKELLENKEKFNTEIADAETKLIDAREKVNDIENAKWYIFNRTDNEGLNGYSQDTDNIERLGEAFPIVFFIIATLISLTSMSRMVEEERVQIGTLKALGYNRRQIMSKYIIYSFLASIIGGFFRSGIWA